MLKYYLIICSLFAFTACQRASEADFDGDGQPDILVKGEELVDVNKGDNVLLIDNVVVAATIDEQWVYKNDRFEPIPDEERTFKMVYDVKNQEWFKQPIN